MQVMHYSGALLVPFASVRKDGIQHGISRAENGGFICHGTYLFISLCKCAYDMKKLLLLLFFVCTVDSFCECDLAFYLYTFTSILLVCNCGRFSSGIFRSQVFWKSLLGKVGRYYSCHECRFSIGWVGFDSCQWYPYGISVVPL